MGLVNAGLEYLMRKVVKVRMGLKVLVECEPDCKTWKGSLRSNDDITNHIVFLLGKCSVHGISLL